MAQRQASLETVCDDPYGSSFLRALDKISLKGINTIQKRRMDLTLENNNLNSAVIFNRITGDERTLYQSEFSYADDSSITLVSSQYAKER